MLTIDEAHGRVTVCHSDGTAEEHALDTPEAFEAVSAAWLRCGWDVKYVHGFTWLGRPIIQLPEDMIRIQEVIWRLRPDVIVETGVAHGGSLIFYASLFEAMGNGRAIGIDIDIHKHNRVSLEAHPLAARITLVRGSSLARGTLAAVRHSIAPGERVLVVLDSNHTRAHVEAELDLYRRWSRRSPISLPATASWRSSPARRGPRLTGRGTTRRRRSMHSWRETRTSCWRNHASRSTRVRCATGHLLAEFLRRR